MGIKWAAGRNICLGPMELRAVTTCGVIEGNVLACRQRNAKNKTVLGANGKHGVIVRELVAVGYKKHFGIVTILGILHIRISRIPCVFRQYNFSYNYGSCELFVRIFYVSAHFVRYFSNVTFRATTFRTSCFVLTKNFLIK